MISLTFATACGVRVMGDFLVSCAGTTVAVAIAKLLENLVFFRYSTRRQAIPQVRQTDTSHWMQWGSQWSQAFKDVSKKA
jgi:hypothetical protein